MRPPHVKCIADNRTGELKAERRENPDPGKFEVRLGGYSETLCGRDVEHPSEFLFINISHAYNHIDNGGRFEVCAGCVTEAKTTLEDGAYED